MLNVQIHLLPREAGLGVEPALGEDLDCRVATLTLLETTVATRWR